MFAVYGEQMLPAGGRWGLQECFNIREGFEHDLWDVTNGGVTHLSEPISSSKKWVVRVLNIMNKFMA